MIGSSCYRVPTLGVWSARLAVVKSLVRKETAKVVDSLAQCRYCAALCVGIGMVIKIAHTHARATQALLDALERSVSSCCDNNVLLVVAHKPVWHVPAAILACLKPVLCCPVFVLPSSSSAVVHSTAVACSNSVSWEKCGARFRSWYGLNLPQAHGTGGMTLSQGSTCTSVLPTVFLRLLPPAPRNHSASFAPKHVTAHGILRPSHAEAITRLCTSKKALSHS